jgi:hypothetical protein
MTTNKIDTIMFAEGWLEGKLEVLAENYSKSQDESLREFGTQVLEMWAVISASLDELIRENTELKNKVAAMRSVVGYDDLKAQITAAIQE